MANSQYNVELKLLIDTFNKTTDKVLKTLENVESHTEKLSRAIDKAFAPDKKVSDFQKRVTDLYKETEKLKKSLDKVEASGDFKKQARQLANVRDEYNYIDKAVRRYGANNTKALQNARVNLKDVENKMQQVTKSVEESSRAEQERTAMLKRVDQQAKEVVKTYQKMRTVEQGMEKLNFGKMGAMDMRLAQTNITKTAKALHDLRGEIPDAEFRRFNKQLNKSQKELTEYKAKARAASKATHEYSSMLDMWWQRFGAVAIGFTVAYRAMNAFENVLYSTIDLMREAIISSGELASLKAEIATYYSLATGSIENFTDAMEASTAQTTALAKASTQSASTLDELITGFSELSQHGVILPVSLIDEFSAFNDLLIQVAKSTGDNIKQVRSEWQGMLEGQMRATNAMVRMLRNIGVLSDEDVHQLKSMGDKADTVRMILEKTGDAAKEMQEQMLRRNVAKAFENWRASMQQAVVHAQNLASEIKGVGNIFGETLYAHIQRVNEAFYEDEAQKHFINLLNMIRDGMDKVLSGIEHLVLGIAKISTVMKNAWPIMSTYVKWWLTFEGLVLGTKLFKVAGAGFQWMHKEIIKVIKSFTVLSSPLIALPAIVYGIITALRAMVRMFPDKVKPWMEKFANWWQEIKTSASDALNWIVKKMNSIFGKWSPAVKRAMEMTLQLPFGSLDVFSGTIDEAEKKVIKLNGALGELTGNIEDDVNDLASQMKNFGKIFIDVVKGDIRKGIEVLGPVLEEVSDQYDKLIRKLLDTSDIFPDNFYGILPSNIGPDTDAFFDQFKPDDDDIDEIEKGKTEIERIYDQMMRNIQDANADTIRDMLDDGITSWENYGEAIVDIMKDTISQIAAAFIQQKFVIPLVIEIAGTSQLGQYTREKYDISGSGGIDWSSALSSGKGFTQSLGLSPGGSGFLSQTIPGTRGIPGGTGAVEAGTGNIAGGVSWGQALSAAGGAYQIGSNIGHLDTQQGMAGTVSGGLKMASAVPGPHQPFTLAAAAVIDVLNAAGVFGGERYHEPWISYGFGTGEDNETTNLLTSERGSAETMRAGTYFNVDERSGDLPETEMESAIADYFDDMFTQIEEMTGESIADILKGKPYQVTSKYIGHFFEEGGGGFEAMVGEMSEWFWQNYAGAIAEEMFGHDAAVAFNTEEFKDYAKEIAEQTGASFGDVMMQLYTSFEKIPEGSRRLKELLEEGLDVTEAYQTLIQEYETVAAILGPAIEAGLTASIETLDFADFKEGLTTNIEEQMKAAVIEAAKQEFMTSIMQSAFDETGSLTDLVSQYMAGDISLTTFTEDFAEAMDKVEAALDTEAYERFKNVLEELGFTVDEASDATVDEASDATQKTIASLRETFTEIIETQGLTDYEQQLYDLNHQFLDYKEQLEDINMLYDEQGEYTDIARLAMAAYNVELKKLQDTIKQAVDETKSSIATLGMESSQASMLTLGAQYGMSPSMMSGGQGMAFVQMYMSSTYEQIAMLASSFNVGISQLNSDVLSMAQAIFSQQKASASASASQHSAAQNARNQMIKSLDSAIAGIEGMIDDLTIGSLAPVQSVEAMTQKYSSLISGVKSAEDPAAAVSKLQSFLPEYLDFMEAYGMDYNTLVGSVIGDLEGLNVELKSERELLGEIATNTSSTATNTLNFLDLGIPISFNTTGLSEPTSTFLNALAEIVSMVGWENPIALDFITTWNWDEAAYNEWKNAVLAVASKHEDGWQSEVVMQMIMSFENWDTTTWGQKKEALKLMVREYGWGSEVTFEFLADLSDAGVPWEKIENLLPEDKEVRAKFLAYLDENSDLDINMIADILGMDPETTMKVTADLVWGEGSRIGVLVGEPVTIAKFGNVNADDWTKDIRRRLKEIKEQLSLQMVPRLSKIRDNTADCSDNLQGIHSGMGFGPGYETGGYHPGGFRLVGEDGPELEFTGPSRIASNEDSSDMIASAISKALAGSNTSGPIYITLNVDRRQIGKVVIDEMKHNPEFGRQMTKQLKVA